MLCIVLTGTLILVLDHVPVRTWTPFLWTVTQSHALTLANATITNIWPSFLNCNIMTLTRSKTYTQLGNKHVTHSCLLTWQHLRCWLLRLSCCWCACSRTLVVTALHWLTRLTTASTRGCRCCWSWWRSFFGAVIIKCIASARHGLSLWKIELDATCTWGFYKFTRKIIRIQKSVWHFHIDQVVYGMVKS